MFLRRREFGLVAASVLACPAIVQSQPKNLGALHDAARKEGELTWYTVPQTSEIAEKMGRTFTSRYPGVKVNVVRTTAQVAYQRLNQDLKAGTPNCDVFTSTDLAHYVDLKGRNLLLKYASGSRSAGQARAEHGPRLVFPRFKLFHDGPDLQHAEGAGSCCAKKLERFAGSVMERCSFGGTSCLQWCGGGVVHRDAKALR